MKILDYLRLSGGSVNSPRALKGQLYLKNGIVYDETGPRIVQFVSDFPALRILQDNPAEEEATCRAIVRANRHGARVFYGLAESEDDYGGFWRGAMVNPYSCTYKQLVPMLQMYDYYGLKLHLSGGYKFEHGWNEERDFLNWMVDTIIKEGKQHVIGLLEWRNEFNVTSPYGGDSEETYAHGKEAMEIFKRIGCLVTMGSPGEDDPAIRRSICDGTSDIAGIDGMRGMSGDLMMKHAHRFYYDGRYKGGYKVNGKQPALWVLEPTGPDGVNGDVYLPLDTPAFVFGMYCIYALTGQANSYFSGPSVRHRRPLDSTWGFYELPELVDAFFPQDIGLWTGPTWFINPDRSLFISVVAEAWNLLPDMDKHVRQWQILYYDGVMEEGTGPIRPQRADWKACAVRGEYK